LVHASAVSPTLAKHRALVHRSVKPVDTVLIEVTLSL
jgi:hypothetical protein